MPTRLVLALAFVSGVVAVAQSDPPPFPKGAEVRQAKARFEEATAKARKGYEEAVVSARQTYLEELDKGVARATKANELDEAIRIRELKKFVESDSSLPRPPAGTREGAFAFRGHQFRIVLGEMSWKEAREACLKEGGDLVSLDSKDKREFVCKRAGSLQLWVGAHRDPFSKRWVWTNGTAVAADSWATGRPKDFGPFTAVFGRSGLLGDAAVEIPACRGYICEWKR